MITEIKLPELGENIESADVVKVLVAAGDRIEAEQPLLELETNKASMELPSPASGIVTEVRVKDGDEVKVGQTLFVLGEGKAVVVAAAVPDSSGSPPVEPPVAAAVAAGQPAPVSAGQVIAAPSVRRAAREAGIDLAKVSGSGPGGRMSKDDVKRFAAGNAADGAHGVRPAAPLPNFGNWGAVRRERMSAIRRATAEHLIQCWTQIPHVTQFDRADITELEPLRKKYADRAAQAGGKLTMAVMVVKVVASALKVFPKFNASIDMEKREIVYKDYVNVGIAVATERGLVVPVLRDTDRKNMVDIAVEVSGIAQKARDAKLAPADMQGGTFTVTNLGSIGGSHFTPIINWPEVAILGMGRAQMEAGYVDGQLKPKIYLPLSLSYDHRVIDGAEGAKFIRWIVEAIEEPLLLSL